MVHSETAVPEICQSGAGMSGVGMQAGVVVEPDWKSIDLIADFEGAMTVAAAERQVEV